MQKIIQYENLRSFCYSNDKAIAGPIKGIVLSFIGLGNQQMHEEDTEEGRYFAQRNIVYLIPYQNPWMWMNRQAVDLTDELVDVIVEHYG